MQVLQKQTVRKYLRTEELSGSFVEGVPELFAIIGGAGRELGNAIYTQHELVLLRLILVQFTIGSCRRLLSGPQSF